MQLSFSSIYRPEIFKNLVAKLLGFFERGKEKRDERGGSDSFSGRRKLFWGNDDHLKSFQLVQSYLWTLGRNYRGISLDEKDPKYSLENPASASWPLFFYV